MSQQVDFKHIRSFTAPIKNKCKLLVKLQKFSVMMYSCSYIHVVALYILSCVV